MDRMPPHPALAAKTQEFYDVAKQSILCADAVLKEARLAVEEARIELQIAEMQYAFATSNLTNAERQMALVGLATDKQLAREMPDATDTHTTDSSR